MPGIICIGFGVFSMVMGNFLTGLLFMVIGFMLLEWGP